MVDLDDVMLNWYELNVSLFTGSTDTMRSFFAQPDHVGVFHYVVDCLDFMMI